MRSWGCSPGRPVGKREVLPAVEGALRHSNGFETVAATSNESAQDLRVECEQSNANETLLERAGATETISWPKAAMLCWIGWIES